ncbi:MAG TPA: hypothetical protein VN132_16715, partial [Bdellovibrio sp.]|nr:hypothetical protein [Bdellovibrio sp.]
DIAPSFSNDAVSTENYSSPSSDFSNFENPDGFNNSDFTSPPEQVSEPEPEAIIESPSFSESPALNEPPAFNEPPMQIPTSGVSDTADFNDVTDFANTTASVGSLTYVVVIDGIDSSQLVYQLKEAMTDSRFGWDVAETLAQMSGGRLVLTGMNSAKAAVLINRIKYLPFKISWRQDVLSGS